MSEEVEERYTLAEAEARLNQRACNAMGHDISLVLEISSPDPVEVFCERCGKRWLVSSI